MSSLFAAGNKGLSSFHSDVLCHLATTPAHQLLIRVLVPFLAVLFPIYHFAMPGKAAGDGSNCLGLRHLHERRGWSSWSLQPCREETNGWTISFPPALPLSFRFSNNEILNKERAQSTMFSDHC